MDGLFEGTVSGRWFPRARQSDFAITCNNGVAGLCRFRSRSQVEDGSENGYGATRGWMANGNSERMADDVMWGECRLSDGWNARRESEHTELRGRSLRKVVAAASLFLARRLD